MENLERRIRRLNESVAQANSYLCAITVILGMALGVGFLAWFIEFNR